MPLLRQPQLIRLLQRGERTNPPPPHHHRLQAQEPEPHGRALQLQGRHQALLEAVHRLFQILRDFLLAQRLQHEHLGRVRNEGAQHLLAIQHLPVKYQQKPHGRSNVK